MKYILVPEHDEQDDEPVRLGAHGRIVLPEIDEDDEEELEVESSETIEEEEALELSDAPFEDVFVEMDALDEEDSLVEEEPFEEETQLFDAAVKEEDPFAGSSFFNEPIEEPKKKRKGAKIFGIVVGSLAVLLAAVYVAGALFFGGHFLPNTVLNGVDVSLKAPADVNGQVEATLSDYRLKVSGYDFDLEISGSEIEYGLDPDHDMLAAFNQWAWPVDIIQNAGARAAFAVKYNQEALDQKIAEALEAQDENAVDPVDAHLAYDEAANKIVIVPEKQGTRLKPAAVKERVEEALKAASQELKLQEDSLVPPAVLSTSEGLQKVAANIEKLTDVDVTLTMGGYDAVRVNKGNLLNWVFVDENFNVTLDESAIDAWAEETASKLDTYGSEHHYIRPDGKEVTVEGGEYGWSVDTAELKNTIVDAIKEGTKGEIAIPCSHEADYYNIETGAEWRHYVDVDLSEQYAYFYNDEGECIWETDIISGNVNYADRHTPEGVYTVQSKSTNTTLYTYEAGKKEPNKTTVAYWMPFIGNVYALHDAWWQPGFGGTMYRDGYGSHGCVNLPSSKAAELYDIISVGDVVVVHW